MRKYKRKAHLFTALICVLCIALSGAVLCRAAVETTTGSSANADNIFIAGNPDMYPIEYFDEEDECYKGVIPELLETVSKNTGISFTYIHGGKENKQKELARNMQVEMVTAFKKSEFDENSVPYKTVVLNVNADGESVPVCIGFTQVADKEVREKTVKALEKIPESEKTESALSQKPRKTSKKSSLGIILSVVLAVVLLTAAILFFVKKNKERKPREVSEINDITMLGNKKAYDKCMKNIVLPQIRTLYYAAYISCAEAPERKMMDEAEFENVQKKTGDLLKTKVEADEYVFHVADGAFVFVYQSENRERAIKRAEELIKSVSESFNGDEGEYSKLFRMGVCTLEENIAASGDEILHSGRQGYFHAMREDLMYVFVTREIVRKNNEEKKIRNGINEAIDNGDFKIYLQFVVNKENEKICGAEALSRWENSEMGLVRPGYYIEIMKQSGLIAKHDYYIFEKICQILENWHGGICQELFLTCNFTRISVSEKDFAKRIKEISDKYRFDREKLVIEVTEDSFVEDNKLISENIGKCKEMGFRIAIDDMGGGFSSISDLYGNDIDIVKIERNVVINGVNEKGRKMLDGIISLAHNMDATVLCEGIETEEQRSMIMSTSCDLIQGFYYSRVLPYDEAMKFYSRQ